ncbi:reverse transcriptase domain-containing protein [Algibacter lectus]|uniref:Reverse transcriptase (RNA-dependent DNA polymerase) n=1 Tax=Algibacter lectus TaxID=221126 RepID=A0A4R8M6P1_9FLAO|nr:reverse transcriptase domain-containing protein [Algibacter lectus]MWW26646.1 hypothetical protein [Algibacter lectus]TDY59647.1 reverse transcriptase (RNA-dependent DNA polymerase) [Algibacter lectus]
MDIKKAIQLAISNTLQEGLTDIFPRPFEVDLLKDIAFKNKVYDSVKDSIEKAINKDCIEKGLGLTTLKIHPISHVLYPKKEAFDFRKCALIDPLDTIKYLSLALMLVDDIERNRINKSKNRIFSYRYKKDLNGKYVFDPKFNFTSFNNNVSTKIKKNTVKVLVKCDISNFYDRLNLHRLESILLSLNVNKNVVKLINEILLFWANRDSYGLPVGSNASRILAEAALLDIDKFLISHKVDFCRFVDDYRFFAPDSKTAHYWLSLLVERLSIEGLYINQSKTYIEDVSSKKKEITKTEIDDIKSDRKKEVKLISGYSGTIPTRFRNASEKEIRNIQEKSSDSIINGIENAKIIKPDDFREYCRVILYKKEYTKFVDLPKYLEKFPQFHPYVVDLLIKHYKEIPEEICESLKSDFSQLLAQAHYLPEYIAIAIVNLLSSEGFKNSEALFTYFRELRRNAGAYIGRATLESLEKIIDRGQVLEIRQYYSRADLWEKRQIVRIIDRKLHLEEKNAWFKNIKMNEAEELFLIGSISKK